MNTAFIIVVILALGGIVVWLCARKSPQSTPAAKSGGTDKGTSAADAASQENTLFELGMNPASDGVTTIYALETCRHCRRTREFLEANNLPFHIIYLDQYTGERRSSLMDMVRGFNPRGSFPTIILPNGKVVVGYREQLLREALIHDTPSAT